MKTWKQQTGAAGFSSFGRRCTFAAYHHGLSSGTLRSSPDGDADDDPKSLMDPSASWIRLELGRAEAAGERWCCYFGGAAMLSNHLPKQTELFQF